MLGVDPCRAAGSDEGAGRIDRAAPREVGAISGKSTELRFVQPEEIDQLPMHHTQRLRIRHFLEPRDRPYLG